MRKSRVSTAQLAQLDGARRAFFDERAEAWMDSCYRNDATGRYDRHAAVFAHLMELLPLRPGDHVLDVGCGSGVLIPYLTDALGPSGVVYEMDYAEKMVAVAKRGFDPGRIRFLVGDAHRVPLRAGICHGVLCFCSFPHFHDKGSAVLELARMLRPDGWFAVAHFDSAAAINTLHHSLVDAPVAHDMLPDEDEITALVERAGLERRIFIDEPGFYLLLAAGGGAPPPPSLRA